MWDHHENIEQIARDFAAMHFGRDAADGMAQIYLKTPIAYKYGLYIEPVAYGEFNSLPHMRVGMFIADGYPSIDNGKVHREFLREIYLRCKPWMEETLQDLDHGLDTAISLVESYQKVKPLIHNRRLSEQVENSLNMTRWLIQTNNLYVRCVFSFFRYREEPTESNREQLENVCDRLEQSCKQFSEVPGFRYQLFGVEQLMENTRQVLDDLDEAERSFAAAPSVKEIESIIAEQQEKCKNILEQHTDKAVKLAEFVCKVDGRDLIRIQGDHYEIEHLRWDHPQVSRSEILNPLPAEEVTVIPHIVQSRPMRPFVLQQPCAKNGYTATIYLNDLPGGGDWWTFDLYWIPLNPEELGINPGW